MKRILTGLLAATLLAGAGSIQARINKASITQTVNTQLNKIRYQIEQAQTYPDMTYDSIGNPQGSSTQNSQNAAINLTEQALTVSAPLKNQLLTYYLQHIKTYLQNAANSTYASLNGTGIAGLQSPNYYYGLALSDIANAQNALPVTNS